MVCRACTLMEPSIFAVRSSLCRFSGRKSCRNAGSSIQPYSASEYFQKCWCESSLRGMILIFRAARGPDAMGWELSANFGDQRGIRNLARGSDVLTNLFDGRHSGQRGGYIRMRQAELQCEIACLNAAPLAEPHHFPPGFLHFRRRWMPWRRAVWSENSHVERRRVDQSDSLLFRERR